MAENEAPSNHYYEGMKVRNIIRHIDRYIDCEAMYELGCRYYAGYRMRPNKRKAYYWFYNAALTGHAHSACILGSFYATGEGGCYNMEEAEYWWTMAAEAGSAEAAENLAVLHGEDSE